MFAELGANTTHTSLSSQEIPDKKSIISLGDSTA
ncbi:hypothetical protein [Sporisorium scitamineum]|uniref:Uncharacterized protein n=1 Tax=Sporisorium scitamineum TaxID=49012 RepID=A0A0F7SAN1_9BASI|nr:hypothetical protein [Sporisorium scitamineum]